MMPDENAILMQPIMLILHKFSSVPLKQPPTDSWKAMAIGTVSDMPMVRGDESLDEQMEMGVMRKSLDSELILSARDIMPFEEILEAKDLDSGLYTEKGVVPMMEVEETLLDSELLDIEKVLKDVSTLAFGGSGRMFVGSLTASGATNSGGFVSVLVLDDSLAGIGVRNRSLKAA